MSNGRLAYYDVQHESSVWLFKSPLAGGGGILWRPHYRPHSLLMVNVARFRITQTGERCAETTLSVPVSSILTKSFPFP